MAVGIRIENTAGPRGKQAVALKISADRSAIYDSAITGHQDTLSVDRGNFMAVGIRVENTAGPRGKQAVALKISADRSAVYDSAITGYQDTLSVDRGKFMAVGIRIENTAGPRGKQAVALKISADRSAIYDSAITGYQDTLCVDAGRQYYSSCYISGFTDFIFGDAAALIDRSTVEMRLGKSTAVITASGRETNTPTGIVIRGCNVTAGEGVKEGSFGRPWKNCSRVVMIGNYLPKPMEALCMGGGDDRQLPACGECISLESCLAWPMFWYVDGDVPAFAIPVHMP
ncbi:unnamed protein product [Closterium sp. Naga37s-1]|nr:unnamed protein product [Closterium sp. Naga37s-1]